MTRPAPRALFQASAIAIALAIVPVGTSAMAAVDTGTYREIDVFGSPSGLTTAAVEMKPLPPRKDKQP